ncbi:protein of unknown function [[Clostridium] ultunense Esp]|uniref:Uncharacterized protein n=1 Tax=[Clostridium] ultunense Esp TaxID=1288971 RepID=A0A1M4PQT0_9FIRM|nr:protein of unknown function [[Clostridium] ultunense Esp]
MGKNPENRNNDHLNIKYFLKVDEISMC